MIEEQNTFLNQPFTVDNLYNGFKDLSSSKIPIVDGILIESFKELWKDVKDNVVTYSNAILAHISLGISAFLSNLFLIPNKETLALITNWRPLLF